MKIAVDTSPVSKASNSAHKVRGVGSYIKMLVANLPRFDKRNEYVFVEDGNFPIDVDLIHYPYFDPFFLTLPASSNKKLVVTIHDLTPLLFPEHFPAGIRGKITWHVQKSRLRKASAIIADSNCSKKDIERIAGIEENKIHTVYLAADEKFKRLKIQDLNPTKIRKKYDLPENFLLYVGDATWNKNLPRLVDAVLKTKHRLVMVGKVWESNSSDISDNPWNKDLRQVLARVENDPQFIRLGFIEESELVKIYNLADALVMPSIYEGFGLPVLEAMSCGCAVITSKEGSLPEIGGDAVVYVDPQNVDDIKAKIDTIAEDNELRMDLSKKGIVDAKKFTIKKSIESLVKLYENLG